MPIINPRSTTGLPHDWRSAWDAFNVLRQIGSSVGEPVAQWKLEFPGRGRRMLDKRWIMTYTWEGNTYNDIFLGIDGKSSREAIHKIIPLYREMADRKKAANRQPSKPQIDNPKWDDAKNKKWRDRYQARVKEVRDAASLRRFNEDNKNLLGYMKQRAGYLAMSIEEYWRTHPHAQMWPAPPRNKEEYEKRQKAFEREMAIQEKVRETHKANGTYGFRKDEEETGSIYDQYFPPGDNYKGSR